MTAHALAGLEFRSCLERVAAYATSALGRDAIQTLEPGESAAVIVGELERVAEVGRLLERAGELVVPAIPDARLPLRRLATAGSVLDPAELYALGTLLGSARALRSRLRPFASQLTRLAHLTGRLYEDRPIEQSIERAIGPDGTVLDRASPELARLRGLGEAVRPEPRAARLDLVRGEAALLVGLPVAGDLERLHRMPRLGLLRQEASRSGGAV